MKLNRFGVLIAVASFVAIALITAGVVAAGVPLFLLSFIVYVLAASWTLSVYTLAGASGALQSVSE